MLLRSARPCSGLAVLRCCARPCWCICPAVLPSCCACGRAPRGRGRSRCLSARCAQTRTGRRTWSAALFCCPLVRSTQSGVSPAPSRIRRCRSGGGGGPAALVGARASDPPGSDWSPRSDIRARLLVGTVSVRCHPRAVRLRPGDRPETIPARHPPTRSGPRKTTTPAEGNLKSMPYAGGSLQTGGLPGGAREARRPPASGSAGTRQRSPQGAVRPHEARDPCADAPTVVRTRSDLHAHVPRTSPGGLRRRTNGDGRLDEPGPGQSAGRERAPPHGPAPAGPGQPSRPAHAGPTTRSRRR